MSRPTPGDLLLHPISLTAVALLLVNDHVLKSLWGNALTGKLSDVAGVLLFPLLLITAARLGLDRRCPHLTRGPVAVAAAVGVTAAGFAAVKLIGPVGDAYALTIGALRWMARLGSGELRPIVVVRDSSDVLVLPVLAITVAVINRVDGRKRFHPPKAGFGGCVTPQETSIVKASGRRRTALTKTPHTEGCDDPLRRPNGPA